MFVRNFSRVKVSYLKVNLKPSLKENPDHFILSIGTNDLSFDRSPGLIAK